MLGPADGSSIPSATPGSEMPVEKTVTLPHCTNGVLVDGCFFHGKDHEKALLLPLWTARGECLGFGLVPAELP